MFLTKDVVKKTIFLFDRINDKNNLFQIAKDSKFVISRLSKLELKHFQMKNEKQKIEELGLYISLYKSIYDELENLVIRRDYKFFEVLNKILLVPKFKPIKDEIFDFLEIQKNKENYEEDLDYLISLKEYLYIDSSLENFHEMLNKWKTGFFENPDEAINSFKDAVIKLYTDSFLNINKSDNAYEIQFGDDEENNGRLKQVKEKLRIFFDVKDKISTPFMKFNSLTLGGLDKNRLYVITGRPGMGKSAFALNLFRHAAENFYKENKNKQKKKYAIYITLENSYEETLFRLLSLKHNIDARKLQKVLQSDNNNDDRILEKYIRDIVKLPMFISYFQSKSITVNDLITYIDLKMSTNNVEAGLIIVDYLNLLKADSYNEVRHALTEISEKLKSMAIYFNCPVVSITQMMKSSYDRKGAFSAPHLGDIKEASGIIDTADMIAFLGGFSYRELQPTKDNNTFYSEFLRLKEHIMYNHKRLGINDLDKESEHLKIIKLFIRKNRSALEGEIPFVLIGNKLTFNELHIFDDSVIDVSPKIKNTKDNAYDVDDIDDFFYEQDNSIIDEEIIFNKFENNAENLNKTIDLDFNF